MLMPGTMDYSLSHLLCVLGLTTLAGLATGIGGFVAFFTKRTNTKFLTFALGFSGGVMVYISFVELLANARVDLKAIYGDLWGGIWALTAFFVGILVAALIDRCVPEDENPHEFFELDREELPSVPQNHLNNGRIHRIGALFALVIGIHNFPEGIATFAAGMDSIGLGLSITLAVAIHNIPEGMVVAIPLYYGTGDRKKAVLYSFASGLAEPAGALLAMLLIFPFLTPTLLALLFACVAGIMVFISFDELLPMAEKWGHHHLSIYGIILGMLVMSFTLL